jgi:hypothetical protein
LPLAARRLGAVRSGALRSTLSEIEMETFMHRPIQAAKSAAVLASLALSLSACGGGSGTPVSSPSSNGGGSSAQSVEGVTTPSSVSVVTAKNAN